MKVEVVRHSKFISICERNLKVYRCSCIWRLLINSVSIFWPPNSQNSLNFQRHNMRLHCTKFATWWLTVMFLIGSLWKELQNERFLLSQRLLLRNGPLSTTPVLRKVFIVKWNVESTPVWKYYVVLLSIAITFDIYLSRNGKNEL